MKTVLGSGSYKTREEVNYYYHFVSHFIGLNYHDPFEKIKPLVPGNVITVEPGLYFEKKVSGLG